MMNDNIRCYTVYMHINLINDKKYIGITRQKPEKRWANGLGYKHNIYFYDAIKKYGWDNFKHIILFQNLIIKEADEMEKLLIKYYKSNDRRFGYNIDGGGISHKQLSDETKRKISEHHADFRGEKSVWFGRKHTEESRRKISESHKGLQAGDKHPMYGKKHSDLSKRKNMMHQPGRKSIECFENDEIYDSISEASRALNIDIGMISAVCRGKQAYAKGLHFRFLNGEYFDILNTKDI